MGKLLAPQSEQRHACFRKSNFVYLESRARTPAGINKRGHLTPPPSGNVVKCFCALVVTEKRSVDELFMHYFHNLSSASGGKGTQPPHRGSIPGLLGYFRPQTPNLPTPGNKILWAPMVPRTRIGCKYHSISLERNLKIE